MRSVRHWLRCFSALVIASVIALTTGAVPHLANSAAAQSLEVHWSDQFEYFFFYDPAVWVVEEEWSDQETDYIILSCGDTYVYYLRDFAPPPYSGAQRDPNGHLPGATPRVV